MSIRLGMTDDDARAIGRKYTNDNREAWKKLGYRLISTQVHDDDRLLVLAELAVRKFQRMAILAEDKDTSMDVLHQITLRNMEPRPSKEDRQAVMDGTANSKARKEVQHFLEQCRHYLRKQVNVENNYSDDLPYESKLRISAKALVYSNLGSSYYKLAKVRLEQAERVTIFGLQGEDSPLVGENGGDV